LEVEDIIMALDERRGDCASNFANQEPIEDFSLSLCDDTYESACADYSNDVSAYISCLADIGACESTSQSSFDGAIDDCLDTLQNSGLTEDCVEAVVGD